MGNDKTERRNGRMIHIRLPEELHRKLRIRAAETDVTIQEYVVSVLKRELERQQQEGRLK